MPEVKPQMVSLESLAAGAAGELFQREFARVLDNIQDPNTDPKAKRTITLQVLIVPHESRENAAFTVNVSCKLAGIRPHASSMYLGEQGGQLVAVTFDPRQRNLFEGEHDPAVSPITRKEATR
jgi:hypothetical protein